MSAVPSLMVRRITRELENLARSDEAARNGISVELENDILTKLRGKITGPPDTPYEGGNYILQIKVPEKYPYKPLGIRFVTKIWHPNISVVTGVICLDTLSGAWTPTMTLRTALLSIQQLLTSAEPDDPLNATMARQFKENPEIFRRTARHWAVTYAGAPGSDPDFNDRIEALKSRGIDEERARTALSFCSWDVQKAVKFEVNRLSAV